MAVARMQNMEMYRRGIDKPKLGPSPGLFVVNRVFAYAVHYTFKILSLHICAAPCNRVSHGLKEKKKKEKEYAAS